MPSFPIVLLSALVELLVSVCVGLALARRLVPAKPVAMALSPIIGWAVFNTLALPLLAAIGLTRIAAALVCAAAALGGVAAVLRGPEQAVAEPDRLSISLWIYAVAALLAIVPTLAVWPKYDQGGVVLSEAMFDHSKAAIIDDVVRLGLPPGNPFYAESGPRLIYYYLWHFSAAVPAELLGASGWEADIALTWFTAFAALSLMIGLAAFFGRRRIAPLLVVLLCLPASLKPTISVILPAGLLDRALARQQWPRGLIFQASWAPQHLASAACVVIAVLILARLVASRDWLMVPLLALIVTAGFESSAWVGGVIFAAVVVPTGVSCLILAANNQARLDLCVKVAAAAVLVLAIAFPFLRDELAATAARGAGAPIAFRPIEVLGPMVPAGVRSLLDLPAYWTILLPIQYPAIYLAGIWAMGGAVAVGQTPPAQKRLVIPFALLAGASLTVPWLFASTIANNDLGWRGGLPGILVLTIFAAVGVARWLASARPLAFAALAFGVFGLPDGVRIAHENAAGLPTASAAGFAESPELWSAVRRYAAPDERIANNPLFLADEVRWPVNISWALLADRRSCYAGWNLARAFAPLPESKIDRIDALFKRVFAGGGTAEDVRKLATRFDCRVIVVTPSDGAWRRDPFAISADFHLAGEKPDRWRIYRVVGGAPSRR
ncbi:MAG TPA: hypothetical protein VL985_06855 [Stellaceae bacterium]|nr:hypothetical protein [Stellaceae bacterium]